MEIISDEIIEFRDRKIPCKFCRRPIHVKLTKEHNPYNGKDEERMEIYCEYCGAKYSSVTVDPYKFKIIYDTDFGMKED